MKTKIRLYISYLLSNLFELPDDDLEKKLISLGKVWSKQEKKVLNGLRKITGLSFARNYIDVFLVNRESVKNSISHPLILRVNKNTERNISILIHELIHNLMWDNEEKDNWSIRVRKLFKDENRKTSIHVAVHAILEAIYVDILNKPEEIVKDIKEFQKYPDYKKAWEIVKKEGYKNIINKLKVKN